MGVVEDKIIKNHYAAEYIYNAYKNTKTCGVIEEDSAFVMKKVSDPIGVVAAVIPTTNPTSTAIFKTLICLKTRNGIIISPHPVSYTHLDVYKRQHKKRGVPSVNCHIPFARARFAVYYNSMALVIRCGFFYGIGV